MYGELCDLAADSAAGMADYLAANRTTNKATNQATNMIANRTANLAANMATNVTVKVTAHKATSMAQGIGQCCMRVHTWLHASHHCGKLELSLTNEQTITYDGKGFQGTPGARALALGAPYFGAMGMGRHSRHKSLWRAPQG